MSWVWLPRRLRTRLFLSYVVVVAAGAVAMLVVGDRATKTVYEQRLGGFGFGAGGSHDRSDRGAAHLSPR